MKGNAKEETKNQLPAEYINADLTKAIEVKKKKESLSQCKSFKMSPSEIKKIIIENYPTEEDNNKQIKTKDSHKAITNNYAIQINHQHSLSALNQSQESKSPFQRYCHCNNNSKNSKSNSNNPHSNNQSPFPNNTVKPKNDIQEDILRTKSLVLSQKNPLLEKMKRNVDQHYQSNTLKNSSNNQKGMRTKAKANENHKHHQWDTLSSRIKSSNISKSKENPGFYSSLKESATYVIDSAISKKLFHEMNSLNNSYNKHLQKTFHKISFSRAKESSNVATAKAVDEKNFNRIIKIVDTRSDNFKSQKKSSEKTSIRKSANYNFSKTFTVSSTSKQTLEQHGRISYHKTDSENLELFQSFKASFRETKPMNYNVLSLLILSNWGNKNKVGVTEIEILDDKDKKIEVSRCHVFNGNEDNVGRLINNKTQTINDNDMWTSPLVPHIKIELYFDSGLNDIISSVNIWNYNGKDSTKGIKEIEISRKNTLCWKGTVPKACFKLKTNYSHKIKLNAIPLSPTNKRAKDTIKSCYLSLSKISHNHNMNPLDTLQKREINQDAIMNNLSASARNRQVNRNETSLKSEEDRKFLSTSIGMSFGEIGQKYVTFNRLKIIFKENYGHKEFIGITGLRLMDKNGNYFGVETASSVGALPKDISNVFEVDDPHIFENTFNNINETIDETNMWLTVLNPVPYLEICYDTQQTLSQIKIFNYNEPSSLDKCAKVIEVLLDDNTNSFSSYTVLLMKGIGSALGDYSQSISFPFISQSYDQTLPNPSLDSLYGIWTNYLSPLLPIGFWFKLVFISNHGDLDYIGLNAIEFFDSEGLLIIPSRIINDPEMKLTKENYKDINNYWLIDYYDVNKVKDYDDGQVESNAITVIFDKIVCVSYIKLYNLVRNAKQGVKALQVFCDDSLIYEGELPMTHREKNEIQNESDILFINNEVIKSKTIVGNESESNKLKSYKEAKMENGFKLTLEGYV